MRAFHTISHKFSLSRFMLFYYDSVDINGIFVNFTLVTTEAKKCVGIRL